MKGLLMMLKAFGLSDVDIEKIRQFVPQVPEIAQKGIATVNKAMADFDARLKALEVGQKEILDAQWSAGLDRIQERKALEVGQKEMLDAQKQLLEVINESIRRGQLRQSSTPGNDGPTAGADSNTSGATGGYDGRSSAGRRGR
jgi:hypothetical protein